MKPEVERAVSAARPLGHFVVYALPVALCVAAFLVIRAALEVDPRGCQDTAQPHQLPDHGMLIWAAAALLVGRGLGYARYRGEWSGWQQQKLTQLAGNLALVLFLAIATVALVYESVGVDLATGYGIPSPEPITYYVRCAIINDKTGATQGWLTRLVLALTCGLIGHWLWPWQPSEHQDTEGA